MIPKMAFLLDSAPVARFFGAEIHRVFGLDGPTFMGVAFVLINTAILAFVLSKLLYTPVRQFLFNRTERIRNQLRHAEEEQQSASALKTQYEAKLKDIEIERDTILEEARRVAAAHSKQVLEEAKQEADAIRERAMKNIEMEQERVKDEVRKSIIDISSIMAQRFVARTMDTETQDRLFTEVIMELEGADFDASRAG